ncbi:MAG: hypothetical protein ACO1NO_12955 [Burkholderiaceae bacterium]
MDTWCSKLSGESMKQREVQTQDNVIWTCVEALSGIESKTAGQAVTSVQNEDSTVPVVCTPNGGEQSVRIELPSGWQDACSDDELLDAISRVRTTAD